MSYKRFHCTFLITNLTIRINHTHQITEKLTQRTEMQQLKCKINRFILFQVPTGGTVIKPRTVLFHVGKSPIKLNFCLFWSQWGVAGRQYAKRNRHRVECCYIKRKQPPEIRLRASEWTCAENLYTLVWY